jgi:hypothetical protein
VTEWKLLVGLQCGVVDEVNELLFACFSFGVGFREKEVHQVRQSEGEDLQGTATLFQDVLVHVRKVGLQLLQDGLEHVPLECLLPLVRAFSVHAIISTWLGEDVLRLDVRQTEALLVVDIVTVIIGGVLDQEVRHFLELGFHCHGEDDLWECRRALIQGDGFAAGFVRHC